MQKLEQAEKVMQAHPDSALAILKTIPASQLHRKADQALYSFLLTQAQLKNNIPFTSDSLINIATDYFDETEPLRAGYAWYYKSMFLNEYGDTKQIANAILKAQEFAESSDDYKLEGFVYSQKAEFYKLENLNDSAEMYNIKALNCFHKINDYHNQAVSYLRLAGYNISIKKFPKALVILNKALLAEKKSPDSIIYVTILNCKGYLYSCQNQFETATKILYSVPLINNPDYDSNKYLTLADLFVKMNKMDSARYYLNQLPIEGKKRSYNNKLWKDIFVKEGNYKQALRSAQLIIDYNDSINAKYLEASFAGLEKKYNYQSLKLKNQHLMLRNKRYTITVLGLILAFLGCFTLFLWWRNRVKKNIINSQVSELEAKQKLFEQESENRALVELQLEKEKQLLEQQLINNHLIETQLRVQKVLFDKMQQYKKHVHKPKGAQNPSITPVNNPVFDQELIVHIDIEYNNFSHRLKNKYPELTEREVLICCLALAGFDSGMMAAVLDIQQDSVIKSRHRIRKRLGVDNGVNFEEFLLNL
jgi:hypothetical protein